MRLVILAFVAAGALLGGCATATAQDADEDVTEVHLRAHNVGEDYWFALEGQRKNPNPKLTLEPGASFVVVLNNTGHVAHNIHFGAPIEQATALLPPGAETRLRFTVPADAEATSAYWCDPHRELGMQGRLAYGPTDLGSDLQIPGPAAVLVLLAVGLLLATARR